MQKHRIALQKNIQLVCVCVGWEGAVKELMAADGLAG